MGNKDNPYVCSKCGSEKFSTYRHMNAKVWCTKCGFVIREEGSNKFNYYIKEPECLCIRATQWETECPHCHYMNDGWTSDPRGVTDTCSGCGREYKIHSDADVEIY